MRLARRLLLVLGAAGTFVLTVAGQTVRVLSVSGEATLQAPGDAAPRALKVGDTILVGTRITTGDGSRVILTPLPGVKSIISPRSDLVVERVSTSTPAGSSVSLQQATLDLKTGAITSDLRKTEGIALDYQVRTARGVAGARGTTYTVGIDLGGIQAVVVSHGNISLTLADGGVVSLVPGQISLTRPDGSTQAVTKVSDLSSADQALAENWMELTIEALAEAIAQGVDIQADALENAAAAAASLGIDLSEETRAALDQARQILDERQTAMERIDETSANLGADNHEVVTDNRTPLTDTARDRFLAGLTEARRAAFLALSAELQTLLVTENDQVLTIYALDPFGEGESRGSADIRYVGSLSHAHRTAFIERSGNVQQALLAHPDDRSFARFALTADALGALPPDSQVFFFFHLTSAQRTAFSGLPGDQRDMLVAANNPTLTAYALAEGRTRASVVYATNLTSARLQVFTDLPTDAQILLVGVNDPAFTAYALDSYNEGQTRDVASIRYAGVLSADFLANFLAAPESIQELLVDHPADTELATFALTPDGEGASPDFPAVSFYQSLDHVRRQAFAALSPDLRAKLVLADNSALTDYALAAGRTVADLNYAFGLGGVHLSAFLALPGDIQALLVASPADTDLRDYALATNGGSALHSPGAVRLYAGYDSAERQRFAARPNDLQEVAANDSAFGDLLVEADAGGSAIAYSDDSLRHYLALPPAGTVRDEYLARPATIRDQLATYGKPGLTAAILDPASFHEGAPTDSQLERQLNALLALAPENQALFETFAGGPTYAGLDSAPGPAEWSGPAWTRTRESFASLAPSDQTTLVQLGAAEGIMDYSGSFLSAALEDYRALGADTRSAIGTAGWGRFFATYFADMEIREVLVSAGDSESFSPQALATLKEFHISPYALLTNIYEGGALATATTTIPGASTPLEKLNVLAALPLADRALLGRLDLGDGILQVSNRGYYDPETESYITLTYAQVLQETLDFAHSFDPGQLDELVEMGLGRALLNHRPDDVVIYGEANVTAAERLGELAALYRDLSPEQREAAQDSGLFEGTYLGNTELNAGNAIAALDAWNNLQPATRDYLAIEARSFDLLGIYLYNGNGEGGPRSLADIDSLVSGLSTAERAALYDIDAAEALFGYNVLPSDLGEASVKLKSVLGFVAGLKKDQRTTLRELGIVGFGGDRQGVFFASAEGLGRLLDAYATVSGADRADTLQIDRDSYEIYHGQNFFFAADDGYDYTVYDVGFVSQGDLRVGATRRLALYGTPYELSYTFTVPDGHDLYLRASDEIYLDSITFSPGIRAISMEAVTLNLQNLDFPEGSVVALTSRDGGTGTGNRYPNFGTSIPGRVNFITNVTYGGGVMFDEATYDASSRGNISIGSFANPAILPTYTPPPLDVVTGATLSTQGK